MIRSYAHPMTDMVHQYVGFTSLSSYLGTWGDGFAGDLIEILKSRSRLISQLDSSAKDLNFGQVVSSAVEACARCHCRARFTRPFVVEPITFKSSIVSGRHGTNPTTKKIQRTTQHVLL
jgi:hypothetical protein